MRTIKIAVPCFMFALILLAAGCAHKRFSDGTVKTKYRCEGGFEFIAETHKDQGMDQVIVKTGGDLYVLDITPSASGSKFSDGTHTFWTKGDSSILELSEKEVYEECTIIK